MAVIKHEAADLRRHVRSQVPLGVRLNNTICSIKDWDLNGFRGDFPADALALQSKLFAQVSVLCQGMEVSFTTEVEVIRLPPEGGVVCRFVHLQPQEIKLLEFARLAEGLNGDAPSLVESLSRFGAPVTPTPVAPTAKEAPQRRSLGVIAGRLVRTLFYLSAGVALGGVILTAVYWHFFRLDLEYAVFSLPLYPVISQDVGRLNEVHVKEGETVRAGQPLLRLEDDVLSRELEVAELQATLTQVDLRTAEARVNKEKERLGLCRGIAEARLKKRQSQVQALAQQLKSGRSLLERQHNLLALKSVSRDEVDRTELALAELEGNLAMARAELELELHALKTLEQGSFFDERRLLSDLQQHETTLDDARARHRVALERLEMARTRAKRLIYCAPFDGKVVKVLNVAGGTTSRGDPLIILEKTDEDLVIDCFATQDEVTGLEVGAEATVWSPALNKTYNARIARIDRTSGFVSDMQSNLKDAQLRYSWRGQQDRSAHVQLSIVLAPDEQKEIASGMPAVVSLPRTPALWRRAKSTF